MVGTQYALNYTPCSIGTYISTETGECRPAGCGSWACLDCGPRKVRRFVKRIAPPAWNYMATFTVASGGEPTKDNIKAINAHWRVFKRWLERNCDLKDFAWVNEQGSLKSRLHKHALLRCSRISYRAARRALIRAGFGRVCDFSPIKTQRGARHYVSKYLAKSLPVSWPKYSRRCQTSCAREPSQPGWTFQRMLPGIKHLTGVSPTEVDDFHRILDDEHARDARRLLQKVGGEWDEEFQCWSVRPWDEKSESEQLALIPNTKKCVTPQTHQGVLDGFGDDST